MFILNYFDLTIVQLVSVIIVAILCGLGKSGLSGLIMLAIPILASTLGARQSTGVLLLFFIIGDIFAVKEYRKHADWKRIKRLLPPAAIGIILGGITGGLINDYQFKIAIAILVLICLVLMIYQQYKGADFRVPHSPALIYTTGAASGFTSMVGNAAGPIFSVYLLATGTIKSSFLGTAAVFFMIINLLKLPVQLFIWRSIGIQEIILALLLTPLVFVGLKAGVWIMKRINEKAFKYLIIIMTAFAAIRLFIQA